MSIRIDEFSAATDFDGTITDTESTRFLLFGFDIGLSEAAEIVVFVLVNQGAKTFTHDQPAKTSEYND